MRPLRGEILPCHLPWSVSLSGSFIKVMQEEEAAEIIVEATVNRLDETEDELRPARVRLLFRSGIRIATHDLGASGRFEPEKHFDASALEATWRRVQADPSGRLQQWRRLGVSEWSNVYEVKRSIWDGEPLAPPWRHFVLAGSELWLEVLARSWRWVCCNHEGQPIGEATEYQG